MSDLKTEDGVLLSQYGQVHRDTGHGQTGCGEVVTASSAVSVSRNQVLVHNLVRCHRCYPDASVQGRGLRSARWT